jgi:hypothetical protein
VRHGREEYALQKRQIMAKECTENTLGGETKKFASNKKGHMKGRILQKAKKFPGNSSI